MRKYKIIIVSNSPYINICGANRKREVKKHGAFKSQGDKFRFIDEEKAGEKLSSRSNVYFSCAVGLLLARAKIFGSLSPLGLAFSAAAVSRVRGIGRRAVGYLLSFRGRRG